MTLLRVPIHYTEKVQGGHGSVRLRFGEGRVRAVPVFGSGGSSAKGGFSVFQYSLTGRDGFGSGFGSWKDGSGGSGSTFGFGKKAVPAVSVSGSGSVPEPP